MVAPERNKPALASSRPALRQPWPIRRNSAVGLIPTCFSFPRQRCLVLYHGRVSLAVNKVDVEDLYFCPGGADNPSSHSSWTPALEWRRSNTNQRSSAVC